MFKLRRKGKLVCSFCRRPEAELDRLIGGPGVHICDACVGQCNAILEGRPTPGFPGWEALDNGDLLKALGPSAAAVETARGVLDAQVEILRGRGVSWAQIGEALGISRQAAWERFS
jgi:hypothetical protein